MAIPANTSLPFIVGTLRIGEILTGNAGTWTGSPTFEYQWQSGDPIYVDGEFTGMVDAWDDIGGATDPTYELTAGELTKMIRIEVTATNLDGSDVAESNMLGPVAAEAFVNYERVKSLGRMPLRMELQRAIRG